MQLTKPMLGFAAILFVAACDENAEVNGIASLGMSFLEVFNQDPNSDPTDAQDVALMLTPQEAPFNP